MSLTYHVLPPLPTGYPLDDEFAIVVPEETVNLISNPSFERNATGYVAGLSDDVIPAGVTETIQAGQTRTVCGTLWLYGTLINNGTLYLAGTCTIARTSTKQRRGVYSLAVTGGMAWEQSLTAGTTYTLSADIYAQPGKPYRLRVADFGNNLFNERSWTGCGSGWQRIHLTFTAANTGTHLLFIERADGDSSGTFWVDGLQLEAKSYPTTYADGDMRGYLRGENAYYWLGTPHASQSARRASTRSGGRIVRLKDIGFILLAITGLGMATFSNLATSLAFGGQLYEDTVMESREFSLAGEWRTATRAELQRRESALVDILRPNRTARAQPMRLLYEPRGGCGPTRCSPLEIVSVYQGGLEGNITNSHGGPVLPTFTAYLPAVIEDGNAGIVLDYDDLLTVSYIVRRDTSGTVDNMAGGMDARVDALAVAPTGQLYAAGFFTLAGGVAANYVARWDAFSEVWEPLGSGPGSEMASIAAGPDGSVYVASAVLASANVFKWDGSTWSVLGAISDQANVLAVAPDGTLWAGTGQVASAGTVQYWNGSTWTSVGATNQPVRTITFGLDGSVYVGGEFTTIDAVPFSRVARWDGSAWSELGSGFNAACLSLSTGPSGAIYATGTFTTAGGSTIAHVAQWNGVIWGDMGGGVNGNSRAVLAANDGMVYLVGGFTEAGGVAADRIARWNGSAWTPMDVAAPGTNTPTALAIGGEGTLYVSFDQAGSATAAAVTTVANEGTADAYPYRIEFVGPGRLVQLVNYTTGDEIYFDLTLSDGERAVLDLTPARPSFQSDFRGNLLGYILPGSTLNWRLLSGDNLVSLLIDDATADTEATMQWHVGYMSAADGTP